MNRTRIRNPKAERGVMLLEALVAILVFSIGILAVVGMQAIALRNVTESKLRSDAAFLASELLSQMWTDAASINLYDYPGSGAVPARITGWVGRVNAQLPGSAVVPPIVSVTGAGAEGGNVDITVRWQLPEEASQGLPPRNYRIIASVFVNPP